MIRRRARFVRPALEPLEDRLTPAIATFTDFDGTPGVRITNGAGTSTLTIDDNNTTGMQTIRLVESGGPAQELVGNFEIFDINMGAGRDRVTIDVSGADYAFGRRSFLVNLGQGNNSFVYKANGFALTDDSNIFVDYQGGLDNDYINIAFKDVFESTLTLQGRLGGGVDAVRNTAGVTVAPSQVLVAEANANIRNSTVVIDFDLGLGKNSFLVGVQGALNSTGLGPATVDVHVEGGDDSVGDTVRLDLTNASVTAGAVLSFDTHLGTGNDFFRAVAPSTFNVNDGGVARIHAYGNAGLDTLSVTRDGTTGPANLAGYLDILLHGGAGDDSIGVDFGGGGFFATSVLTDAHRGLTLRIIGAGGDDNINVILSNNATADLFYDLLILGNDGNDDVAFDGDNDGGNPSYGAYIGAADCVILDGGVGFDLRSVEGNFIVMPRNFEGQL